MIPDRCDKEGYIRSREPLDVVIGGDDDYAGPVLPAGETGFGDVEVYPIAFCPWCGRVLVK